METLVINIENENDAQLLVEQLNQLNYVKQVFWTNRQESFNHILPGEALSDEVVSNLLEEAENDDDLDITDVEERIKNKYEHIWMLGSSKKHT